MIWRLWDQRIFLGDSAIVESPTWFDARMIAMRIFGCDAQHIGYAPASAEHGPVVVELRWVGNDGDAGGSDRCRHLEYRKGPKSKWKHIDQWVWP